MIIRSIVLAALKTADKIEAWDELLQVYLDEPDSLTDVCKIHERTGIILHPYKKDSAVCLGNIASFNKIMQQTKFKSGK